MRKVEQMADKLTKVEQNILINKGTDVPFEGEYDKFFELGMYFCKACHHQLFDSGAKYDSGCGWPAFYQPVDNEAVKYIEDNSHGMKRVEIECGFCGGHLGHVFKDANSNTPTGDWYCVNSTSLEFGKHDQTQV